MSQEQYIEKVLKRFNMDKAKVVSSPLTNNFKMSVEDCPKTKEEIEEMDKVPYASAVGSLMYAMVCTRPDIAHAVGVVSRFLSNPEMSDNGSVPSPTMKDSDHLFGPSEIGPKFAYEAGIRRKIISNNDMFPEWAGYIRRLRACELEEGGSLCNHILEMMNYMNRLEYLDTNFDRNLAVPLLLRSLPDSYNDFLWKNHCENKSKTWIEIINELRRYEEDKITQKGKLEEEKGKEKRKEKHYALDAQVGCSKRRKSCSWRDLGNGERKCPKNIEESMGSSS
ncbi:hypothetical protein OROMI_033376 [Orobanche minor]